MNFKQVVTRIKSELHSLNGGTDEERWARIEQYLREEVKQSNEQVARNTLNACSKALNNVSQNLFN